MTFKELKKECMEKIKNYPEYKQRLQSELISTKVAYDNNINLYEEFKKRKKEIDDRYVIPFLLGFTEKVDIEKPIKYIQCQTGASGGIDIDSDLQPEAKEAVNSYLKEKYGENRVISVGTYTRMGVASAAKDLLRIYEIPFKQSNAFTSELDSSKTWEENLKNFKTNKPSLYKFYENHKEVLDMVPYFISKIRQTGKHAGGVAVLDRPVYELIPVERVSGVLVSGFGESGAKATLDELGIVKLDVLGISILDVISNTINSIEEKLFLIEDDDGIEKIVPESYINERIQSY